MKAMVFKCKLDLMSTLSFDYCCSWMENLCRCYRSLFWLLSHKKNAYVLLTSIFTMKDLHKIAWSFDFTFPVCRTIKSISGLRVCDTCLEQECIAIGAICISKKMLSHRFGVSTKFIFMIAMWLPSVMCCRNFIDCKSKYNHTFV